MEAFKKHLEDQQLSYSTIKTHLRQFELFKDIDIHDQDKLLELVKQQETLSKQKTLASTISKYLNFVEKPLEKIRSYLADLNTELAVQHRKRSQEQVKNVGISVADLKKYIETLFNEKKWREYVILYCFVYLNCRNQDLIAEVVDAYHEMSDDKNYFVISKKKDSCTFYRNVYKTSNTYNRKINKIVNKKFLKAITQIPYVLKANDNMDRVIKKITSPLGSNITESLITKLVLSEKQSMIDVERVSKNRGTSISTLHASYNGNTE